MQIGPLEWSLMEAVWTRTGPVAVRDLSPEFPNLVYTTIMTTMVRLAHKGLLTRVRQGRLHLYSAAQTREEYFRTRASDALRVALRTAHTAEHARLLLAALAQEIAGYNAGLIPILQAHLREMGFG